MNSSLDNKRDNYHIVSLIGQGAYGQVFKARRKGTGQFVAIKTIKKKNKQEKDIVSMREEIEILKKLKHENIVLLLDSFETNQEFVIITELGQGELFNIIEDDQFLPETEIRRIAQQLVRALHYLHSNRITHRDMKPQNILISSNGVIKLCDFGFARHMSYNTQVLTSIKGTPLYMAPEMVKELPYTHTADLWSLGVILFELATGAPPFTASNLFGLVEHIVNDPIRYPDSMSSEFKAFLKGLLNKNPSDRLGWPQLLNHPFIRETEAEKQERKRRTQRYNAWLDAEMLTAAASTTGRQENTPAIANNATSSYRSNSNVGFEEKRDVSPRKVVCNDDIWNRYEQTATEQKGANQLRSDAVFLDKLLTLLSTNINEILRAKDKKSTIQVALKILTLIIIKSKLPQSRKIDILKNSNIPNYILNLLKSILKIDGGKNNIEFISDIIKTVGLLAKSTFDKAVGVEMVYLRSFLPLLPLVAKAAQLGDEPMHHNLITNLVKTIGIFANNSSANHIRSFNFYKDLVEVKFVNDCVGFLKQLDSGSPTIKFIVQVFSVLMHPVYGDISTFPWRRTTSTNVGEFTSCQTMFECVRQSIMNCLFEIDWISLFVRVYKPEEESSSITKISILRVLLQAIRQSKEFIDRIVNEKQLIKLIFGTLQEPQPLIYSTGCVIISLLMKYFKEKKKEKAVEATLKGQIEVILDNLEKSYHASPLVGITSLMVLQEVLNNDLWCYEPVVARFRQPALLKILGELLSNPQTNKIEEIRKVEGSNYGCHLVGFYDYPVSFLHKLLIRFVKQNESSMELYRLLEQTKVDEKLVQLIVTLSPKTDLSPRGFITLLMLVHDLISEYKPFAAKFFEESCFKVLVVMLRDSQLLSIQEWPVGAFGGGATCIQLLSANLMKIFILSLQQSEPEVEKVTWLFYNNELVKLTINLTKYLSKDSMNSPLSFLCRLVLYDSKERGFIRQFVEEKGLSLYEKFTLLSADSSSALILESLALLSQLARFSKDYYQDINEIQPYVDLKRLIGHTDPAIRSRVLNLIGNLCRHTSYFYEIMQKYDLIKECIRLCEDPDRSARKFACVAVGNAGFHDSSLYESLKPAIPVLVELLKDPEEKTRSNAAAALGNFVRNSAQLDHEFVRTGAIYQLMNVVVNDSLLGPKKIALMSINNLMSLPESAKVLMSMDIRKVVSHFLPPQFNSEPGVIKTATKIMDKINQCGAQQQP